jgi:hypothetical protein
MVSSPKRRIPNAGTFHWSSSNQIPIVGEGLRTGAEKVDTQIAERVISFLIKYAENDLPKSLLDSILFGGIATLAVTIVADLRTGGRRKRALRQYALAHSNFVEKLKTVADGLVSGVDPEIFKSKMRPQLYKALTDLSGQHLVLYAELKTPERGSLLEYLERAKKLSEVFDFKVPKSNISDGKINYKDINRFVENIDKLFEIELGQGALIYSPCEQLSLTLKRIIGAVFWLPFRYTSSLKLEDSKLVDKRFAEIRATLSASVATENRFDVPSDTPISAEA